MWVLILGQRYSIVEMFDCVEVWRVAWQGPQLAPDRLDQRAQHLDAVERSVVQDHNLPRTQDRIQLSLEPRLDQFAVAIALKVSLKGERGQHFSATPRGDHTDPTGAMPQTLGQAPHTAQAVAPGEAVRIIDTRLIDTCLIHINPLFFGHPF